MIFVFFWAIPDCISMQLMKKNLKAEDHTTSERAARRSQGDKSEGKKNTHFKACTAAAACVAVTLEVKVNTGTLGSQ